MAVEDDETSGRNRVRLSPGDAAFERLKRREALRDKDLPSPARPLATTATPSTGSSAMPSMPSDTAAPGELPADTASTGPGDESTPRIFAVAAAFGFDVAEDLLGPPALPEKTTGAAEARAGYASPVFAAAKALGVGTESAEVRSGARTPPPASLPESTGSTQALAASASAAAAYGPSRPVEDADVDDEPVAARGAGHPVVAMTSPAVPVEPAEAPAPESPAPEIESVPAALTGDAAAARLEAALLDQLRSLEETLQVPPVPVRLPQAEPLRLSAQSRPSVPRMAEPAGAPGRSPFAPDPVRQRTYFDLSDPAPPEPATPDDAPWRKYLAEPPRRASARPVRSVPRPTTVRSLPGAGAAAERTLAAQERGRGIRAMSAAVVLGLGVGLGLLVLLRPFAEEPTTTAGLDLDPPASFQSAEAPTLPASPERDSGVDEALATLLAEPSMPRGALDGPAVIAEAGTPREALVTAQAAPPEVVAPKPPLISPEPGQPIPVTRGAMYGPERTLSYGPSTRTYDPFAQSVLREQGAQAALDEASPPAAEGAAAPRPAASARDGSRATINSFVNLRARPDNASPVVAVLAQGLAVRVIGCDYWCEVEAGGKRGYVFKKFVSR